MMASARIFLHLLLTAFLLGAFPANAREINIEIDGSESIEEIMQQLEEQGLSEAEKEAVKKQILAQLGDLESVEPFDFIPDVTFPGSREIRFEKNEKGKLMVTSAVVNGTPGKFILDTGASHTVLTPEFVKMADLEGIVKQSEAEGNIEAERVQFIRVASLVWGEMQVDINKQITTGTDTYGAPDRFLIGELPIEGIRFKLSDTAEPNILGVDFLRRYIVTVDAPNEILVIQAVE